MSVIDDELREQAPARDHAYGSLVRAPVPLRVSMLGPVRDTVWFGRLRAMTLDEVASGASLSRNGHPHATRVGGVNVPASAKAIDPLAACDLNLLIVLNALLEERHVTRAGERLALSQPATSSALKRLRRMFDDPLLTKQGNEMVLSPRAHELRVTVGEALSVLRAALRTSMPFHAATTAFTARIDTTDYSLLRLFPRLQNLLGQAAPQITLKVEQHAGQETLSRLRTDQLDIAIGQFFASLPAGIRREHLFHDDYVCVMRADHPVLEYAPEIGGVLPLEQMLRYPHLRVPSSGTVSGVVNDALARIHLERRVACEIPNVLAAPYILARSDLIAFLPEPLVQYFARRLPLAYRRPDIELDGVWTELIWHTRSEAEPAQQWLRSKLVEIAQEPDASEGQLIPPL